MDPLSLFQDLYQAVMSGQGALAAALALVAAVFVLRKFVAPMVPFFGTDAGGALLVLLTSETGALLTAVAAAGGKFEHVTGALLLKALQVGFAAAGGWAVLKKLVAPAAAAAWAWLQSKLPAAGGQ